MTVAVLALKAATRLAVLDAGGLPAAAAAAKLSAGQVSRCQSAEYPETLSLRHVALVEAAGPSLHITRALAQLHGAAVIETAREIPHHPMAARFAELAASSGALFAEVAAALADQHVSQPEAARLVAAVRHLLGHAELAINLLEAR